MSQFLKNKNKTKPTKQKTKSKNGEIKSILKV